MDKYGHMKDNFVLIEPYWNVNILTIDVSKGSGSGINRTILECKYVFLVGKVIIAIGY